MPASSRAGCHDPKGYEGVTSPLKMSRAIRLRVGRPPPCHERLANEGSATCVARTQAGGHIPMGQFWNDLLKTGAGIDDPRPVTRASALLSPDSIVVDLGGEMLATPLGNDERDVRDADAEDERQTGFPDGFGFAASEVRRLASSSRTACGYLTSIRWSGPRQPDCGRHGEPAGQADLPVITLGEGRRFLGHRPSGQISFSSISGLLRPYRSTVAAGNRWRCRCSPRRRTCRSWS